MSTATARAYQPYFAGRFMPSGRRTSPEIKPFHGYPSTYLRKAHCIKDRVLLDPTCGGGNFSIHIFSKYRDVVAHHHIHGLFVLLPH